MVRTRHGAERVDITHHQEPTTKATCTEALILQIVLTLGEIGQRVLNPGVSGERFKIVE